MSNRESLFPCSVQPAHLEFYSWKPFRLPIDERLRHLKITGEYIGGQKRYLSSIITQDIEHIRYTERYGHLAPKYEHSQMINSMTVIASGGLWLREVVEHGISKNHNTNHILIHNEQDSNECSSILNEVQQIDFIKLIQTSGILYVEYDPIHPNDSLTAIEYVMNQLAEHIPNRSSKFIHAIVIEDADMFLQLSPAFGKHFRALSNDRRLNKTAITANFSAITEDKCKHLDGFKNSIEISMNNRGKARLTSCGTMERFDFMPFAPVEPIVY